MGKKKSIDIEKQKELIVRDAKGRFAKGNIGGFGGRKKGSVNKVTKEVGTWLANFLQHNTQNLQQDFDLLSPKDKFAVICNLLPYILPKKKELNVDLQQQEVLNIAESVQNLNQIFGITPTDTPYTDVTDD